MVNLSNRSSFIAMMTYLKKNDPVFIVENRTDQEAIISRYAKLVRHKIGGVEDYLNSQLAPKLTKEPSLIAFHDSPKWKEISEKAKDFYGKKCMMCGCTDRPMLTTHIRSVTSNPNLTYNFDNVQIVCVACNNNKHVNKRVDYRPRKERQRAIYEGIITHPIKHSDDEAMKYMVRYSNGVLNNSPSGGEYKSKFNKMQYTH